jgi:nicotinamidase-related amidase
MEMTPAPQMRVSEAVLLFVDLQEGLVQSSRTNPPGVIRKACAAAVTIAGAADLPMFASVIELMPQTPPAVLAELADAVSRQRTFLRRTIGAFEDEALSRAVRDVGVRTIVLGGVASEVAVLHTASQAVDAGFQVHVLVDASGGLSERTEQAAFRQIERAGGVLTSVASFGSSLVKGGSPSQTQTILGALRGLL